MNFDLGTRNKTIQALENNQEMHNSNEREANLQVQAGEISYIN